MPHAFAGPLVYPKAMTLKKTVALVGMMGAGKTSIGKRLAQRLDVPFADADHVERQVELITRVTAERFEQVAGEGGGVEANQRGGD